MVKQVQLGFLFLLSVGCTRSRPMTVDASVDGGSDRNPVTDGGVDATEENRLDAQGSDGPIPCAQAVTIEIAAELGLADPENWRVVALERSVDGRVVGLLQHDTSGVRYLLHWQVTEDVAAPLQPSGLTSLNLNEWWPDDFPDINNINNQIHIGSDSIYLGLRGDYTFRGVRDLMVRFTGVPLFCWACGASAEVLDVSIQGGWVDFMQGVPGRDTLYLGGQRFSGFGVYTEGATGLLPSSDSVSVNAMDVFAGLGFRRRTWLLWCPMVASKYIRALP